METLHRKSPLGPLLIALVLGTGALAAWIFVWSIVASIVVQWDRPPLDEYVRVNRDSEVIIQQFHRTGEYVSFRTTDGQTITDRKKTHSASVCYLSANHPKLFPTLLPWEERIKGFGDGQNPPTAWYMITTGQPYSRAYLVGYDSVSKQLIGYLGLQGFRADWTPETDQFVFPADYLRSSVVSYFGTQLGRKPPNFVTADEKAYTEHVISGGKLYRINIDRRTVEPVELSGDVICIREVSILKTDSPYSDEYDNRIAARTLKNIYIVSYEGKAMSSIPIPTNLQNSDFDLYIPFKCGAIFTVSNVFPTRSDDVYWTSDTGQIVRQLNVPLGGGEKSNPKTIAWSKAALLPAR